VTRTTIVACPFLLLIGIENVVDTLGSVARIAIFVASLEALIFGLNAVRGLG
jgi:hypothetical protein